ncbi:MAG: pyridoxine 5'-phosphate synthase [Leptospiraceae bacterium]|nr:pyridoxine 5'-phosphate synthase [Leptospiraceae bacterium]
MTNLSVNLNKIAWLRNARPLDYPSVLLAAQTAIEHGAQGITVHPRPDERHIRQSDVLDLADLLTDWSAIEFNIEGNPFEGHYLELVEKVRPVQCTLVPDAVDAATSNSGWKLSQKSLLTELAGIIHQLHSLGCRVSLFMDAGSPELEIVEGLGADRIEIYTEPWASAFGRPEAEAQLALCKATLDQATELGLVVNAGHDLSRQNLPAFLTALPAIAEVSIGHALVADAVFMGLAGSVESYLQICKNPESFVDPA